MRLIGKRAIQAFALLFLLNSLRAWSSRPARPALGQAPGVPRYAYTELPPDEDYFDVYNREVARFLARYHNACGAESYFPRAMIRSVHYLPRVKRIFRSYGIPEDLAYLGLVESGFRSDAVSTASAVGIWQFVQGTGRLYGLQITASLDERRDFYKATCAAARFLRDLRRDLGDWYLALAAYNAGPGYVKRVVRKGGTRDFWTLARRGLFHRETSEYVPRFLAARRIAMSPLRYGYGHLPLQPLVMRAGSGAEDQEQRTTRSLGGAS